MHCGRKVAGRRMKKWQLADSFFRLRLHRAKPVNEENRRFSEYALRATYKISGKRSGTYGRR